MSVNSGALEHVLAEMKLFNTTMDVDEIEVKLAVGSAASLKERCKVLMDTGVMEFGS